MLPANQNLSSFHLALLIDLCLQIGHNLSALNRGIQFADYLLFPQKRAAKIAVVVCDAPVVLSANTAAGHRCPVNHQRNGKLRLRDFINSDMGNNRKRLFSKNVSDGIEAFLQICLIAAVRPAENSEAVSAESCKNAAIPCILLQHPHEFLQNIISLVLSEQFVDHLEITDIRYDNPETGIVFRAAPLFCRPVQKLPHLLAKAVAIVQSGHQIMACPVKLPPCPPLLLRTILDTEEYTGILPPAILQHIIFHMIEPAFFCLNLSLKIMKEILSGKIKQLAQYRNLLLNLKLIGRTGNLQCALIGINTMPVQIKEENRIAQAGNNIMHHALQQKCRFVVQGKVKDDKTADGISDHGRVHLPMTENTDKLPDRCKKNCSENDKIFLRIKHGCAENFNHQCDKNNSKIHTGQKHMKNVSRSGKKLEIDSSVRKDNSFRPVRMSEDRVQRDLRHIHRCNANQHTVHYLMSPMELAAVYNKTNQIQEHQIRSRQKQKISGLRFSDRFGKQKEQISKNRKYRNSQESCDITAKRLPVPVCHFRCCKQSCGR